MPLKVLTFNIAHGAPYLVPMPFLRPRAALRRTLDGIAALLAQEAADVVALQEVDRKCFFSGGVDQVAHIAAAAGYAHVLHGEHLRVPGLFAQGTALLSRVPLHEPEVVFFQADRAVDKGFVAAAIHWKGHVVDVVSVHLDPFSQPRRLRQVQRLAEALERRHRQGRLLVVMGDFNSSEGNPGKTVERLCASVRLHLHEPGGGEPTYTTTWPRQRLDWILVSPELRYVRHARVPTVLSDHFPVMAELDLVGASQG
ncbi:endonuclease/exonuclease/phosphatase family protein [Pyxidicoccus xibeiensis]|uniref:endonuclease/exonuclease/phosphatase family protein n=1 Tax=Pyxidicoccus xibeiensis TaxID=2906759 RepID=UPI0020A7A794|nr:endonuclease/exonuclease/phosphatase family protein [Pyxidicoccus xibeiensis]MCP3136081.1 endonuclease/exonuclease/phosphatase family protein [Pyxidicoccus xibeiensis]